MEVNVPFALLLPTLAGLSTGVGSAAVVGQIVGWSEGLIRVRSAGGRWDGHGGIATESMPAKEAKMIKDAKKKQPGCCAHDDSGPAGDTIGIFEDFLGSAMSPGALDVVTKELMAIALGLAVHCVPCTKIHIRKARSMGIGVAEMEEAAALAVAFSGCRALMLWNELKKEVLS